MKKINIAYWIVTILFAAFMIFSAIPNIMTDEASVKLIHEQLKYPVYFIPFLGVVKLLGALVILIPGIPRIKEWAYAGLVFDLSAATYSVIALGLPGVAFMLLFVAWALASYFLYHRRRQLLQIRNQ